MSIPDLHFAELDSRKIEAAVIAGFEAAARLVGQDDFKLYPGDPRRLFLEAVAMMIAQQNSVIDLTGKGNLLRFAKEKTIEEIGWLYGKRGDRLQPAKARTTISFTLSASRPTVTTIPAGTKLSAGKSLTFSTVAPLEIPARAMTGSIAAECTAPGPGGNGLLPGQITTIVDRPPFVASAANVTASAGGADVENIEAYRSRIRAAPESFSVAGPDGAYEFWAKTASAAIVDVGVWSPTPGEVNIAPLLLGGELPTQDILDAVLEVCNDKRVRPLTDFLHVISPEPISYALDLTYWIDQVEASSSAAISAAVNTALDEYSLWQGGKLGRDINPSELIRRVMAAGARRVEVRSPAFAVLEQWQVATQSASTVLYGGLEHA